MENDRDTKRPAATLHWLTVKKLECFAAAAAMPVAAFAAQCVRAGFERHAHMAKDRDALVAQPCARCARAFRMTWQAPDEVRNPRTGESKRLKIPLDAEALARVDALAEAEFTDRPSILNWLVVHGLSGQQVQGGREAWREFAGKFLADGGTIPKWPTN